MKSVSEKKQLQFIKLSEYRTFDYEIPNIFLDFIIEKNKVTVKTELILIKKNKHINEIILNGINIEIKNIYLDNLLLGNSYYIEKDNLLILKKITKKKTKVMIEGIIKPKKKYVFAGNV